MSPSDPKKLSAAVAAVVERDFDFFCAQEFSKVLEKEVARLERGEPAYTDREIGNMLGCTKNEIYGFRRRQRIPDAMGRMAGYCRDILSQPNYVTGDVRSLEDKIKTLQKINKTNEHIKGFEKAWWFTVGFLSFFILLFFYALIFGERAAS